MPVPKFIQNGHQGGEPESMSDKVNYLDINMA